MEPLQTKRLKLRPVAAGDEAAVIAGAGDLAVSRWLAVVPHPYTSEDFNYFLSHIATPGGVFAVDDANGLCGVVGAPDGVLGYWFAARAHGRGYATNACRKAPCPGLDLILKAKDWRDA
jgi:RimJ/RimL family protein N-acetyltransferase